MLSFQSIRRFLSSDDGTTAVEYAVMIALIIVVALVGLQATGGGAAGWWSDIDSDLQSHGF